MIYRAIRSSRIHDVMESNDGGYIILISWDGIEESNQNPNIVIADKGRVLTRLTEFWFDQTKDICPNAFITSDNEEMNAFFREDNLKGRCLLQHSLRMLPIDIIVHGYITEGLWDTYSKDRIREICGQRLHEGLRKNESMPEVLFTPVTKKDKRLLSFPELVECLEKAHFVEPEDLATRVKDYSLKLYDYARSYARGKGIIIAEARFKFGIDDHGVLRIGDELLTPDSARFWSSKDYILGQDQPSLDKHLILNYLKENPDANTIPSNIIDQTRRRYLETYHMLTGKLFL